MTPAGAVKEQLVDLGVAAGVREQSSKATGVGHTEQFADLITGRDTVERSSVICSTRGSRRTCANQCCKGCRRRPLASIVAMTDDRRPAGPARTYMRTSRVL